MAKAYIGTASVPEMEAAYFLEYITRTNGKPKDKIDLKDCKRGGDLILEFEDGDKIKCEKLKLKAKDTKDKAKKDKVKL